MKGILLIITLSIFAAIGTTVSQVGASSAGPVPSPTPSPAAESVESIKEFLITSAATDFTKHQPPYPAKFRKVKIGHLGDTTKSGAWRMCGEFLPSDGGDKPEWTGFVTVKTSGYEQYIGSDSPYCNNSKIVWHKTGDLSAALKRKLDSLKKEK